MQRYRNWQVTRNTDTDPADDALPPNFDPPGVPPTYFDKTEWQARLMAMRMTQYYYGGDVFREELEPAAGAPDQEGLTRYPLRFNLVAALARLHAYAVTGDFEENGRASVFQLEPFDRGKTAPDSDLEILGEWERHYRWHTLHMEQVLTQVLFGAAVWHVTEQPAQTHANLVVGLAAVHPMEFFPVFSPVDGRIEEALIVRCIPAQAAIRHWNLPLADMGLATYRQWWRPDGTFQVSVNQYVVSEGRRPLRALPFLLMPNGLVVSGQKYGPSLADGVTGLQDEINERLRDLGGMIMKEANKPLLLRGTRNEVSLDGSGVALLEADNPEINPPDAIQYSLSDAPQYALDMISFLRDLARDGGHGPGTAWGEDMGSQRSGVSQAARMWPLSSTATWTRASNAAVYTDLIQMLSDTREALGYPGLAYAYAPVWQPTMAREWSDIAERLVALRGVGLMDEETAASQLQIPEYHLEDYLKRARKMWTDLHPEPAPAMGAGPPGRSGSGSGSGSAKRAAG